MTQAKKLENWIGQRKAVTTTKAIAAAENYAAEDVISESTSAGTAWEWDLALSNGGGGFIVAAISSWETTALTPRLRLLLFDTTPTGVVNDNVANDNPNEADVNSGAYLGFIDFPELTDLGGVSSEQVLDKYLPYVCASSDTKLYGIVVTRDAITGEAATDNMHITLQVLQD